MDVSLPSILALMRFSVQDPRAAARNLLATRAPDSVRWLLFGFVATASTVLTHLSFNLMPPVDEVDPLAQAMAKAMADAMSSPLRTAAAQAGFLLLIVAGVHRVGRWLGGKGSFSDTLLLIGWLQFIFVVLQALQVAALLVLPPVAEILAFGSLVLSFWLLTQFVVELHGFRSAVRVFFGIVATLFLAALAVSLLLVATLGAGG